MTTNVISLAKEVIGDRDILLVRGSLFDIPADEHYDIIVSDGVLHCTYDTYQALRTLVLHLKPGGDIVFSLINVFGTLWWFPIARFSTRVLGVGNYHRKARWGRRLFSWTRKGQEGTKESARVFRSEDSWAYDWFANPRWNLHSPSEVRSWLEPLGLKHVKSIPSIVQKDDPQTPLARSVLKTFGGGTRMLATYWTVNGEPNMMYVHARKKS
jgi:SAM-dependent methyltransferase